MQQNTDSIKQMYHEMNGFVGNLIDATALKTGVCRHYNRIIFCGMGASAIGGELIANTMYYSSSIPVTVAKTASMPCWIDKNTLVVVCSYSGNTLETIDMYKDAMIKKLDVIAVTGGGVLEELSIKNGNMMVKIGGEKIQPRSAIGWFIGILAGIVEDAGGPKLRVELKECFDEFESFRKKLESDNSVSRKIAASVYGKIPVIYSVPDLSAVAVRWKNQFNENSKIIAFSGVIPEFNHNEVVGWCEDSLRDNFEYIIINDEVSKVITNTMNGTCMALKDVGISPLIIEIGGKTSLERSVKALLIGDYSSLFLAERSGKDPCEVNTIKKLKDRIEKNS